MMQIRIVIADDHEVVRLGTRALLQQHMGFTVVGEAATGEEAVKQTLLTHPDVVVMDIRMPGMSGIDACRHIRHQSPGTRVVMLTSYAEDNLLFSAIRAGASGYVLKRIGTDDLLRTVEAVARGDAAIDPAMTEALFKQLNKVDKNDNTKLFACLTDQEIRVLVLIADGLTNRDIAERLFLSDGTVRNYVSNVLSKLSLSNRAEAAAFAVQHKVREYVTLD
jgi:two-component system response regulator DevR